MHAVVRELSEHLGLGDAIAIVRKWGGRKLYVPVSLESGHPLALTLGLDTAQKLVSAFGGQHLHLPIERNALIDLRNSAIVRDAIPLPEGPGRSTEQIGLDYGLSRQAVESILAKHRRAPE